MLKTSARCSFNLRFQGKNEALSNNLGYIVKAGDYLGYTLITLPIMILFIPLVDIFSRFIHPSPWFWLPFLIAIPILIFRLNTSQKLIVFVSLFIFYAVIWFLPPKYAYPSKLTSWNYATQEINGLFYSKKISAMEYTHHKNQVENFKILMLFLPATIGFCYLTRKTKRRLTYWDM